MCHSSLTQIPRPASAPNASPNSQSSTLNSQFSTRPRTSILGLASVKTSVQTPEPVHHIVKEVKELTEADLKEYWNKTAEELELMELLSEGVPHLGEKPGQIEIDAQTVSFADEFKPHKIDVMESLRDKTGMRMLDCKVNPLFVSKEEVVYSPEDKYRVMLETNPKLAELHKLFPLIDY